MTNDDFFPRLPFKCRMRIAGVPGEFKVSLQFDERRRPELWVSWHCACGTHCISAPSIWPECSLRAFGEMWNHLEKKGCYCAVQ